jgi:lysozyme family protein/peptidoglycan hydrolase-like protein with peptidoglycan-binding domain
MTDQVPPWLASQRADLGQEEIPGPANNPRIIAKARLPGVKFPNVDGLVAYGNLYNSDDTQAWCGAETGGSLAEVGLMPPFNKGNDLHSYFWADSFDDYGVPCDMRVGAIATYGGHVNMVDDIIDADTFWGIGGNQSSPNGGAVTRSKRSRSSVKHFRWPDDASLQQAGLIQWSLSAKGAVTTTSRPLIKAGASGGFVTELQKILGLNPTGIFDAQTDAAVRAFQRSHNLDVDGEVGPLTWGALLGAPITIIGDIPHAAEYHDQWQRMVIAPAHAAAVEAIAHKVIGYKTRYQVAVAGTSVPWWFIGPIHERESSCDFSANIHNGQPLGQVTTLEPKGRGPFASFEASVADWIKLKGLDKIVSWPIERVAYQDEINNGLGYRNKGVPSAYLWSFSNIYTGGKYVADHVWSAVAIDKQCGTMPLLKKMMELDHSIVLANSETKPVTDDTSLPTPVQTISEDPNFIVKNLRYFTSHPDSFQHVARYMKEVFGTTLPSYLAPATQATPTTPATPDAPPPATPTSSKSTLGFGAGILGLIGAALGWQQGTIGAPVGEMATLPGILSFVLPLALSALGLNGNVASFLGKLVKSLPKGQ